MDLAAQQIGVSKRPRSERKLRIRRAFRVAEVGDEHRSRRTELSLVIPSDNKRFANDGRDRHRLDRFA